ncbi:MAG: hypothetical protein VX550_06115 [Bacteroidota bacterium]|nr:hypothetical protein [Bacteroidota bacterium]
MNPMSTESVNLFHTHKLPISKKRTHTPDISLSSKKVCSDDGRTSSAAAFSVTSFESEANPFSISPSNTGITSFGSDLSLSTMSGSDSGRTSVESRAASYQSQSSFFQGSSQSFGVIRNSNQSGFITKPTPTKSSTKQSGLSGSSSCSITKHLAKIEAPVHSGTSEPIKSIRGFVPFVRQASPKVFNKDLPMQPNPDSKFRGAEEVSSSTDYQHNLFKVRQLKPSRMFDINSDSDSDSDDQEILNASKSGSLATSEGISTENHDRKKISQVPVRMIRPRAQRLDRIGELDLVPSDSDTEIDQELFSMMSKLCFKPLKDDSSKSTDS